MAATSVFSDRLGKLWSGFIREWAAETGRRHPEIAWQVAVEELVDRAAGLRPALAALASTCEVLCERLQHGQESLKSVMSQLEAAVNAPDDALALVLIHQRNALAAELDSLRQTRDTTAGELAEVGEALVGVEEQRLRLLAQAPDMLKLLPSTGASMMQRLQALSVTAELRRLARSRKLSRRPCAFPQGCESCLAANEADATAARRELDALHQSRDWPRSLPA
jgi:phage shock protein A